MVASACCVILHTPIFVVAHTETFYLVYPFVALQLCPGGCDPIFPHLGALAQGFVFPMGLTGNSRHVQILWPCFLSLCLVFPRFTGQWNRTCLLLSLVCCWTVRALHEIHAKPSIANKDVLIKLRLFDNSRTENCLVLLARACMGMHSSRTSSPQAYFWVSF